MNKVLLLVLILILIGSGAKLANAQGLPFGTPSVIFTFPCPLSGNVLIKVIPPSSAPGQPPPHPPGPFVVPPFAARYAFWIYPPVPGTRMLGTWIPGGVCIIPFFPHPIIIPALGTVTSYGSAWGIPGLIGF